MINLTYNVTARSFRKRLLNELFLEVQRYKDTGNDIFFIVFWDSSQLQIVDKHANHCKKEIIDLMLYLLNLRAHD